MRKKINCRVSLEITHTGGLSSMRFGGVLKIFLFAKTKKKEKKWFSIENLSRYTKKTLKIKDE